MIHRVIVIVLLSIVLVTMVTLISLMVGCDIIHFIKVSVWDG